MNRYFIVYKPYKMISQFVSPYEHRLLGDLDFQFPEGTQAVGRLDEDSEGLLILTTDKKLNKRLLLPERKHTRSYIVQVQKIVDQATIDRLQSGIEILIKQRGAYQTKPCEVKAIGEPPKLAERADPVQDRVPNSWLQFTLTEGKNRQIRKMCKAVKHKCLRLIRTKIEGLELGDMRPGEVREIPQEELFLKLFGETS